jgi:hypothetical protein
MRTSHLGFTKCLSHTYSMDIRVGHIVILLGYHMEVLGCCVVILSCRNDMHVLLVGCTKMSTRMLMSLETGVMINC